MVVRLGSRQDVLRLVVGGRAEAEVGDRLIESVMELVAVLFLKADHVVLDAENGELLDRESTTGEIGGVVYDVTQSEDGTGGQLVAVVAEIRLRHQVLYAIIITDVTMLTNDKIGFTSYRVGVSAEAVAAAVLAHAGYDVSVQYGANQPLYDLIAVKPDRVLQVSVKGNKDGGWNLTGSYKKGRSYQEAADAWMKQHGRELVFILVQYENVVLGEMPRIYLARAYEIAAHLKTVHLGRGDTVLLENHQWIGGTAKGHTDAVPKQWKLSQDRVDSV